MAAPLYHDHLQTGYKLCDGQEKGGTTSANFGWTRLGRSDLNWGGRRMGSIIAQTDIDAAPLTRTDLGVGWGSKGNLVGM